MTSRDEAVERIAAVLHKANVDCGHLREFDIKSCADWSARHTNPAYSLYDAGLRMASTTGLDAARLAQAVSFAEHALASAKNHPLRLVEIADLTFRDVILEPLRGATARALAAEEALRVSADAAHDFALLTDDALDHSATPWQVCPAEICARAAAILAANRTASGDEG